MTQPSSEQTKCVVVHSTSSDPAANGNLDSRGGPRRELTGHLNKFYEGMSVRSGFFSVLSWMVGYTDLSGHLSGASGETSGLPVYRPLAGDISSDGSIVDRAVLINSDLI